MKTAAAYIRVSTDRQTELSPDSQLNEIRAFAQRNNILLLEQHIYRDEGISGTSVKHRDSFLEMISAAHQQPSPFNCIIVWKFSRFARNRRDSIVYKTDLKKCGVQVISVSEPLPDDDISSVTESLIESMDEYYSKRLSTEVYRGMIEKVSRGLPVAAPPIGYRMENGRYYPDGNAELIKGIFTDFAEGLNYTVIAKKYTALGLRTTRGGIIDKRCVEYIICNPVYVGKIRWCKRGRGASRRDFDNENNIITDGVHEPIISTKLWEECQKRRASLKKVWNKHARQVMNSNPWAFKGLVRCRYCGATIVSSCYENGGYRTQCNGYVHGTCSISASIKRTVLDEKLTKAIENVFGKHQFKVMPRQLKNSKDETQKLIHSEEAKLKRLTDAYLQGVIELDDFAKHKSDIKQKISAMKKSCTLLSTDDDTVKYGDTVMGTVQFIRNSDDENAKAVVLRSVLSTVLFDRPENRLELFLYF